MLGSSAIASQLALRKIEHTHVRPQQTKHCALLAATGGETEDILSLRPL